MSKSNDFNASTALNSIKPVSHWVDAFSPVTKKWPKGAGECPTPAMLSAAVATFKNGRVGRESLYMAMAMRPEGVTLVQFILAGAPWGASGRADNHIQAYSDAPRRPGGPVGLGWFTRSITNTARCLVLTQKGLKAIQGLTGAVNGGVSVASPPKAKKATTKPRKPKAAPKPTPTPEPLPNVPVEAPPIEPPQAA